MDSYSNVFKNPATLSQLNAMRKDCLLENLGIEFTAIGHNFIEAKMPVDKRTKQPMGLLHGGASVSLSETLGSIASYLTLDMTKQTAVGLEINTNHIASVKEGYVQGKVTPIHIGKTTQVWSITIKSNEKLVAISRITMAVLTTK